MDGTIRGSRVTGLPNEPILDITVMDAASPGSPYQFSQEARPVAVTPQQDPHVPLFDLERDEGKGVSKQISRVKVLHICSEISTRGLSRVEMKLLCVKSGAEMRAVRNFEKQMGQPPCGKGANTPNSRDDNSSPSSDVSSLNGGGGSTGAGFAGIVGGSGAGDIMMEQTGS